MRRLLVAIVLLLAGTVSFGLSRSRVTPVSIPASSTGGYIITLKDGSSVRDFLADNGIPAADVSDFSAMFAGFAAAPDDRTLRKIASDPRTASIQADEIITTDQTINPTGSNSQWGIDVMDQRSGAPDGNYSTTATGSGVTVYEMDTGVYAAHPDFGGRVAAGWSYRADSYFFTSQPSFGNKVPLGNSYLGLASGENWCKTTGHPYNDGNLDAYDRTYDASADGRTDNNGHGTHVAGIIGSTTYGVAKGATIVPIQMLNSCGEGMTSMALRGIQWILARPSPPSRALVNMSIGFEATVGTLECVINGTNSVANTTCTDYLLKRGYSVVAAAGNGDASGRGVTACGLTPASTTGTFSVGAVQLNDQGGLVESSYSNYGSCVGIFAPGTYVKSTWTATSGSPTEVQSGTSMATPHVSGAVALFLENLSLPADVSTIPTLVWNLVKKNATCGVVNYFTPPASWPVRTMATPNRFVNAGSAPAVPCAPTGITKTQESGRSTIAWSELPSANGSDTTGYQVTTNPATTGCTTNASTFTCALTGLTDGTTYTVSVQGINGVGAGTAGTISLVAGTSGVASTTTTVAPTTTTTVAPTTTTTTIAPTTTTTVVETPSTTVPAVSSSAANPVTAVSSTKSLLLRWPAVTSAEAVTYVVSVTPGGVSCTTSNTSCTFLGVSVGTVYNFSIVAKTPSGQTSVALRYTVTAGINQKYTSVKKSSRTTLTKIVTSLSKGKRTYKVTSGKCKVSAGRLVAPSATETCKLKVSIAKYRTYKAMSAVLTIHVV